jgi:uncharacterized protein YdbL (DUF1318 family)
VANDDYYHIVGSVAIGSEVYLNERYADILLDSSKNPRLIIKSDDNNNIFLTTLYITARDLTSNTAKLNVKLSPDAGNLLSIKANGLYASANANNSDVDYSETIEQLQSEIIEQAKVIEQEKGKVTTLQTSLATQKNVVASINTKLNDALNDIAAIKSKIGL